MAHDPFSGSPHRFTTLPEPDLSKVRSETPAERRTVEIANGEEPDGIAYRCHMEGDNWVVTITQPDGSTFIKKFGWSHDPVCGGPDVADVAKAEEIMERLVKRAREEVAAAQWRSVQHLTR